MSFAGHTQVSFRILLKASLLLSLYLVWPVSAHEGSDAEHVGESDVGNPHACSHLWQEIGLPVSHKDYAGELGGPDAESLKKMVADLEAEKSEAEEAEEVKKIDKRIEALKKALQERKSAEDALDGSPRFTIVCRDHFITQYNSFTKNPDWVIERLTREVVEGMNTRPSVKFTRDRKLPEEALSAVDNDYRNSGYARGHQAASADFKSNLEWMKETFIFSNAVPQVQNGFNGGVWKELEEHVQDFAKSLDEDKAIYIITGPVDLPLDGSATEIAAEQNGCANKIRLAGLDKLRKRSICDANDKHDSHECIHGVAVPTGLYKIVYVPFLERAFGFLMSNEDHRKFKNRQVSNTEYFEKWRASLDVIEDASSLNFFPGKSRRSRNIHEESCAVTRWRQ